MATTPSSTLLGRSMLLLLLPTTILEDKAVINPSNPYYSSSQKLDQKQGTLTLSSLSIFQISSYVTDNCVSNREYCQEKTKKCASSTLVKILYSMFSFGVAHPDDHPFFDC